MSGEKQSATVKDLVEEAKKRIVLLIVCVVGLSYLMSLTSSSVLINLPVAGLLIIIIRYFSLDFEMRRRAITYKSKPASMNSAPQRKPFEGPQAKSSDWRQKVNSPAVEDAIDQFTRHIVSEWVTDLWYSRITSDRQGPEELVQIINGVLAEISRRSRNINLINLLTRDIIGLMCTNLELFRASKTKIEKQQSRSLSIEELDVEIKYVLAADNKLHPALFSSEAEHKVLQHLMDGLISLTFKPEDLQCSLFRYIVRELLACVVIRPVLNLASPRFINERIESLVISLKKADKGSMAAQVTTPLKENGSLETSSDQFSPFLDPSVKGVELVQFKKDQPKPDAEKPGSNEPNGTKDPLLLIDTRSTRSWSSLPSEPQQGDEGGLQRHRSGEEWGDMLDMLSRRKTEALAPEHFDDMWTKGRNYKTKEGANRLATPVTTEQSAGIVKSVDHLKASGRQKEKGEKFKDSYSDKGHSNRNSQSHALGFSYKETEEDIMSSDDSKSMSNSSYTTEDEEISVTGLDSPGVKVWGGKNRRNVHHIHHPLENFDSRKSRKTSKGYVQRMPRTQSKRKKSRLNGEQGHVWQEVERTSFLLGDGQDLLKMDKGNVQYENSSDDSEAELLNRISSGATASSCVSSASLPDSHTLTASSSNAPIISDSFWKLRCEVSGANIVKSGSRTFAVYSISVTDVNNNSWSIKRRFRHFEELHRRLKEFPEYNLHLPPKHFLSTGLDVFVIQERCKLLNKYLKELLQLPTVSGSIEVWDFLSVDSQTYLYSNPLTIVETLSVDLDAAYGKTREHQHHVSPAADHPSFKSQQAKVENMKSVPTTKHVRIADGSKLNAKNVRLSPSKSPANEGKAVNSSSSDSDDAIQKNKPSAYNFGATVKAGDAGLHMSHKLLKDDDTDPALPSEWVPPNLSLPIFDLVDVIFQLQDGGWIRRKALWVAKQVLQLGMGDAFDDWLIEKIQVLRRGSVVASGIRRLEQILWPDGIFITKHPRRQKPTPASSPSSKPPHGQPLTPQSSLTTEDTQRPEEIQRKEAERRAQFVYELMIDKAPAAIVGLVGRKEYEQCAKDLYYFIQSSVSIKKLVLDLLELLLLSAFPELDDVFRQIHDDKERFGELKRDS